MFKLAAELGMTVAELGRRMSGVELMEWVAYYRLENGQGVINLDTLDDKQTQQVKQTFKRFKSLFERKKK